MAQKATPSAVKIRKSTNPITGILNVVGEPDGGKTTFALSSGAAPERTAFIDDDVKGAAINEMVEAQGRKFGLYHNLMLETKGMRELQFHEYCMSIIQEIDNRSGEFDVLVWDTWTRFENTFHPVVAKNPTKYREFYSSMGQIKGAEQWNAAFDLESATLAVLQETVPLIVLVSHLKKDAVKKDIAESKKPLIQKSRMRVWLRHNPNSPEPIGLILKRLSKIDVEHGMQPVNVTHRKMVPFTWKRLLYYWDNPVANTQPTSDETPNEFELSILDGVLTKDQKDALRLAVLEAEKEKAAEEFQAKALRMATHAPVPNADPEEPFGLMAKAMELYDIDTEKLCEILGLRDTEELMEVDDVPSAWKAVKAYAAQKVPAQSNHKKRK